MANQSIGAPGKGADLGVSNVANPENWKTFGRNISKILEHLNLFHLEGWDMPKGGMFQSYVDQLLSFFPVLPEISLIIPSCDTNSYTKTQSSNSNCVSSFWTSISHKT